MAFRGGLGRPGAGGPGLSGPGGKFDQEDRSRDWYCSKCSERNFLKRGQCYKCGADKPKDGEGGKPPSLPATGSTLNGMVKSYNRKGFGFIMCFDGSPGCQDIYYSRENLHASLQTRDIPGEHVTFEIQRFPDGKLVAKNVRPHGATEDSFRAAPSQPAYAPSRMAPKGGRPDEEDRSRDWICDQCGERNFVKRFECFKCKARRPPEANTDFDEPAGTNFRDRPPPRRTFSPHAGARAIREQLAGGLPGKRARSGSGSSSSSSSSKKKKKKKKAKKKRSSSSSSSKSSKSSKSSAEAADKSADTAAGEASAPKNPEVEKAKAESLEKLMKLRDVEPMTSRMKEYRELLRQWHPDKNPEKVEVATAVFQFLQKAKPMIAKDGGGG